MPTIARPKKINDTEFKGVVLVRHANSKFEYRALYKGVHFYHEDKRKCAIKYDEMLLKDGKEPVNILKRK